jgi:hypothetical protein
MSTPRIIVMRKKGFILSFMAGALVSLSLNGMHISRLTAHQTNLVNAIFENDMQTVTGWQGNPNFTDLVGRTPLEWAAFLGNFSMLLTLYTKGAIVTPDSIEIAHSRRMLAYEKCPVAFGGYVRRSNFDVIIKFAKGVLSRKR